MIWYKAWVVGKNLNIVQVFEIKGFEDVENTAGSIATCLDDMYFSAVIALYEYCIRVANPDATVFIGKANWLKRRDGLFDGFVYGHVDIPVLVTMLWVAARFSQLASCRIWLYLEGVVGLSHRHAYMDREPIILLF